MIIDGQELAGLKLRKPDWPEGAYVIFDEQGTVVEENGQPRGFTWVEEMGPQTWEVVNEPV